MNDEDDVPSLAPERSPMPFNSRADEDARILLEAFDDDTIIEWINELDEVLDDFAEARGVRRDQIDFPNGSTKVAWVAQFAGSWMDGGEFRDIDAFANGELKSFPAFHALLSKLSPDPELGFFTALALLVTRDSIFKDTSSVAVANLLFAQLQATSIRERRRTAPRRASRAKLNRDISADSSEMHEPFRREAERLWKLYCANGVAERDRIATIVKNLGHPAGGKYRRGTVDRWLRKAGLR